MPDLFQTQKGTARDQRFRDNEVASQPMTASPSPVEPYLSEESEIPIAPTLRKPKHTKMHYFTSYCELPPNVTFESQEENEKILLFVRKSFFTNIIWLIISVLLLCLPFVLFIFFPTMASGMPGNFLIALTLFYFLFTASYFFVNFITWYFNIVLVTEQRIVDIDFEDLVYKNVAETKLSLIQDVSSTELGAISTIFDYGDVLIQTAGTIDNFDLHAVPIPERIVNIVEDLIGKGRANL